MKAKRVLKKLNYLPRWAWYLASLSVGGPIGPLFVYLAFHALEKMAKDEADDAHDFAFDVDIDADGVHVRRAGSSGSSGRASRFSRRKSAHTGYRDEECIVTGEGEEDVLDQWARAEQNARRAQAEPAYDDVDAATAEPQESAQPGSDIDDVVHEVNDAIRRIRRANDLIPDDELSAQLSSIEESCGQILSILEQRPQLLAELRTFLRYYLPTTLKLLDARVRLESTASTPKAREVRARISEALGVIDKAFAKQVEALDEYRFIDLESEMDVLRDMLRADGLVEEDQDEDPFAAVLGGH